MATVTCRACGTAFPADAFVCPHCKAWRGEAGTGAPRTNEPSNRILQTVAIALMIATLMCTIGLMLLWNSTPLPSARPPETSRPSVQELPHDETSAPTTTPAGNTDSAVAPPTQPTAAPKRSP
jgi:hypothetical protein